MTCQILVENGLMQFGNQELDSLVFPSLSTREALENSQKHRNTKHRHGKARGRQNLAARWKTTPNQTKDSTINPPLQASAHGAQSSSAPYEDRPFHWQNHAAETQCARLLRFLSRDSAFSAPN
jgi:hypothetical protein